MWLLLLYLGVRCEFHFNREDNGGPTVHSRPWSLTFDSSTENLWELFPSDTHDYVIDIIGGCWAIFSWALSESNFLHIFFHINYLFDEATVSAYQNYYWTYKRQSS